MPDYSEEENKRECLKEWEEHFDWFKENLFPTFGSYGFTFAEAYMAYNTRALVSLMDNQDEEDEQK